MNICSLSSNVRHLLFSSLALVAMACSSDDSGLDSPDGGAGDPGAVDAQDATNDAASLDSSGSKTETGSGAMGSDATVDVAKDAPRDMSSEPPFDSTSGDAPTSDAPASDAPAGDASSDPTAPPFPRTGKYMISIPVGDAAPPDPADVYYPDPPDLHSGSYSFPIVLLFQGAKVARNFYSNVLATVASYGFIVVAPDHMSNNIGGPGLYAELSEINYALAQMKLENTSPTAPVKGVVDTAHIALIGHSYGGASGLSGMANLCFPPIPFCSFTRPPELVGGAFYGTNIGAPLSPVDTGGLPVLLVQGDKDGKATPASGQQTFDALSKHPKAYITLLGANHYGVTDMDNPAGADPEVNAQTLDHASGVASIGRWMGVFFSAYVAKNQTSLGALRTAAKIDPNVMINLVE